MSSADHFAHRETDGVVVDLYWNRGLLEDEFRIEVVDERRGDRFVLYSPRFGEAIDVYNDPVSVTRTALDGNAPDGLGTTRPSSRQEREIRP